MKKSKKFDCVQMKWEIQQRILAERQNLEPAEARRLEREQIDQDPVLGPFLQKVHTVDPTTRTPKGS